MTQSPHGCVTWGCARGQAEKEAVKIQNSLRLYSPDFYGRLVSALLLDRLPLVEIRNEFVIKHAQSSTNGHVHIQVLVGS